MPIEFPGGPSGIHPPTAALQKILHSKGFRNPITGEPFTEAMLLGIGGGLDTGYILYRFAYLPHPMLILGFRNQWNNTRAFVENLANRLSLDILWQDYSNRDSAQKALQAFLRDGIPTLVWVDKASLPYREISNSYQGQFNHQVTVYARDGRRWRLFVDDLSDHLIEVREKELTAARESLPQNNFLTMVIQSQRGFQIHDFRGAILDGIRECSDRLNHPLRTVGVSCLDYWAEKLTHQNDPQGWPIVFHDPKDLYPALRTIYTSIRLDGTEGYALRRLYSDFLHESAGYLGNPELNAVAGQYLQLSNHWAALAESALSSQIPAFENEKSLLKKQARAYRQGNFLLFHQIIQEVQEAEDQILQNFPLDERQINDLLGRLSNQVKLIAELEKSAALRLHDISRG